MIDCEEVKGEIGMRLRPVLHLRWNRVRRRESKGNEVDHG